MLDINKLKVGEKYIIKRIISSPFRWKNVTIKEGQHTTLYYRGDSRGDIADYKNSEVLSRCRELVEEPVRDDIKLQEKNNNRLTKPFTPSVKNTMTQMRQTIRDNYYNKNSKHIISLVENVEAILKTQTVHDFDKVKAVIRNVENEIENKNSVALEEHVAELDKRNTILTGAKFQAAQKACDELQKQIKKTFTPK